MTYFKHISQRLDQYAVDYIPLLARFTFAATLLLYFWNSALTKIGTGLSGLFTPALGAYAQIFPRKMEAVGYDVSQFGWFEHLVVLSGTYAEFLLPALVVLGLLTRLSSLGMIGFIVVQSLTDIVGHGVDARTTGAWFDRFAGSLILDQRAFWVLALLILVSMGGGKLSLDRVLRRRLA